MNLVDEKALFPKLPAVARVTLASICLVLLTIAVFWQVAQHEFISYDDPEYVTNNPHVRDGFTSEGIRWAFTQLHGETTYWHPVTWLSHMLDCELFDLNAGAHHLVNVALHSANAVLLFLWLATLSGAFWRSWLVAAIFALHPIQVDTVAWIAERKNVLSTLLLLATVLCYSRYVRRRTARWYAISLLCFAVGLMSKPMLVTLPGILLLLDFWPLQRFPFVRSGNAAETVVTSRQSSIKWLLLEKIPFLTLAIISAVITVRAHQELGMERLPLSVRLGNAAVSYIRYIGKTLAPH